MNGKAVKTRPFGWYIGGLLLVTGLLFLFNLLYGSILIPFEQMMQILFLERSHTVDATSATIVWQFRFPQAVTAVMAGSGLAVAGLIMQTLFRNPLADPSILGISAGSSLGVAFLLMATGMVSGQSLISFGWLSQAGLVLSSFTGAVVVLLFILVLSKKLGNMVSLLIAGIMIAYVAGALVGIIKYYSHKEDLQAFVIWGLGTFSNVASHQLPFFSAVVLIGLFISLLMIKPLNMLILGEGYAANLGLNVKHTQLILLLTSGFLTAVVTAYTGPIAFLGLAVPHLARNLFKTSDHRKLLPSSIVMGALLALFCNLIARLPGFDGSLPINSITALIGAPVVVYVLLNRKQIYTGGQ